MKYTHLLKFIIAYSSVFLLFDIQSAYSQARSGIGIAYSKNKPYSGDYNFGGGFQVQGDIKLLDKLAIVPNFGFEEVNSKGRIVYEQFTTKRISSLDLFYIGASAKYFFNKNFFAKGGAIVFIAGGNEDISGGGIGGTAAAGYSLNLDNHSSLEFSVNTDLIYVKYSSNGLTPIGGLKIAYIFNFRASK